MKRFDRLRPAEDGPAQRMVLPETLRKQLVHEVIGRVLDHLDLLEDHLLLAFDVFDSERRIHHDVREDVDGERQMLVQHFDVVARVFLCGESIQLTADGIDHLRDVFGRSRGGAFEQHVLDEMRDASVFGAFMPRSPRQPDADADRTHLRHALGEKTEAVIENVSADRWIRQDTARSSRSAFVAGLEAVPQSLDR